MIKAAFVIFVIAGNGSQTITPAPYNQVFDTYEQCSRAARYMQHEHIIKNNLNHVSYCVNLDGYKQGPSK